MSPGPRPADRAPFAAAARAAGAGRGSGSGLVRATRAASTSALVMRPEGPLPETARRSTPASSALRFAIGVARGPSAAGVGTALAGAAGFAGAALAPALSSMRAISAPISTVSPSWARRLTTTPATGAGSSASTLSVVISTSG